MIYERPAIYQKTPLIQALRPDDDIIRSTPPEPDGKANGVKSASNDIKYRDYRSQYDRRYDGRPQNADKYSHDDRSANDVRLSDITSANGVRTPHNVRVNEGRSAHDSSRVPAPDERESNRNSKAGKFDRRDFEATVGEE